MLLDELVSIGFNQDEARKLADSNAFHHKRKSSSELEEVLQNIQNVYGCTFEEVKKAVLTFPPFAGLDHSRVVSQATEIYGDEDRVKKAVLTFPPFAGLDHSRVVSQKTKLGKIAGLTEGETINHLLDRPALVGCSARRYLAAFDIGRALEIEGFKQNNRMFDAFISYFTKSPYVPNSKRRRISQVTDGEEPPLMISMRKKLSRSLVTPKSL